MVELLALYGENDREMGSFLPGMRRTIRRGVKGSSQYFRRNKIPMLKIHGEYDGRMGAFLPGLMKQVKKVGKVTSGITTGLARSIGIPQSAINAFAKIDPTKKGSVVSKMQTVITPSNQVKQVVAVPKAATKIDTKKIIIIASSGLGALILIKMLVGSRR